MGVTPFSETYYSAPCETSTAIFSSSSSLRAWKPNNMTQIPYRYFITNTEYQNRNIWEYAPRKTWSFQRKIDI